MSDPRSRRLARRASLFVPAFLACLLGGCGSASAPGAGSVASPAAPHKIAGTLVYRDRAALPPQAQVTVRLVDTRERDQPVIAESRFDAAGRQPPIPFVLSVDADKANPGTSYLLRAQISVDGKTRYVTGARVTVHPAEPPDSLVMLLIPGDEEPAFGKAGVPRGVGPSPVPGAKPKSAPLPPIPGMPPPKN